MAWSNGSPIDEGSTNEQLDSIIKTAVGGTHLIEQTYKSNGFTVIRFKQKNLELNNTYRFRFVSPDDLDIFMAGMSVRFRTTPTAGAGLEFSTKISGSTGDAQNDLPVDDHLFLTAPVTNILNKELLTAEVINDVMYIKAIPGLGAHQHAMRYGTYALKEDEPCNTLLKGASYDVDMKVYQDPSNAANLGPTSQNHMLEFFMMLRTNLRRN